MMSRLEKKCVIASAAMHGLLLVIALVGPAFLSSRKDAVDLPLLDVIPSKLVDAALSGGGNPNAKPPPPAEKIQQQQPSVQQPISPRVEPQTAPKPVEPKPQPVRNPETLRQEVKVTRDVPEKTAPPKREIKVSKQVVKLSDDDEKDAKARAQEEAKARAKAEADARRRATQQALARVNGASRSLSENLSSGTTIDMPGPGGEAYANYTQVVKSIYDHAWIDPQEVSDEQAVVQVKVVIARDGKVISDVIIKKSGNAALDKSVQNALDRVDFIAPFPEGAKDSQRTFIINFNLKAKRLLG
jgi:colicin import membrane protein